MLLDSGSFTSAINDRFLSKLEHTIIPLDDKDPAICTAANSSNISITGKVVLPLMIGDVVCDHTFYVIKSLSVMCLLGLSAFKDFNILCNYTTGKVSFFDGSTELNLIRANQHVGMLRIARMVALRPNAVSDTSNRGKEEGAFG